MIMSQDMENRVHAAIATSLSRFSHEKPANCNSEDLYEALGVTRRLAYGFMQMEYRMWAAELMVDVANAGLKQGCFDFAEGCISRGDYDLCWDRVRRVAPASTRKDRRCARC
jgi:hypothetical protein